MGLHEEQKEPLSDVHVMGLNVTSRLAVAKEGFGKIKCWLDSEADETPEYADAAFAVVEWDFGGFTTIPLSEWKEELTVKPN